MTVLNATHDLDAHARPPDVLKAFYKKYQKAKSSDLASAHDPLDFSHPERSHGLKLVKQIRYKEQSDRQAHKHEDAAYPSLLPEFLRCCDDVVNVYELEDMPGLLVMPNLLPPASQKTLLDRLIHRDVSKPAHMSNLHLHYDLTYPPNNASFFSMAPNATELRHLPKKPDVHRPINTQQMLNKKLRWITLGGQYDWTNKTYPAEAPPQFPPDIAEFLQSLFPNLMTPQAAIVNFYSPGDTLSLHRDVAEECDRGLISLSIGCDGIFILGLEDEATGEMKKVVIRLRSGDAVFMDGKSRYSWHGVPQIVRGSCPEWLKEWPGEEYPAWKGWMEGKRINLNVRQMFGED